MDLLYSELSIEIYKSIIDYNPDAIFILTVDGKIVKSNEAMTKIFGYTKEEIQDLHFYEIVLPEQEQKVNNQFNQVLQGVPCQYETKGLHKNSSVLHLQVKKIPMIISGEIVGVFGVVKDITELHKTKETLNQMEVRLNALFNSMGDAISILDIYGNVVGVNPAFEEIYGWKREEVIGNPLPVIPPSHLTDYNDCMQRAKLGERIVGLEVTCIKKNGRPVDVSLTFSPIRDANGNVVGTSGITRDITEKKKLEMELKEREEKYKLLVESSPEPIVMYQNEYIQYANPACIKLFGATSLEDVIGKPITTYFHPESARMIKNRMKQPKKIGKFVEAFEKKVIRKDGTLVDIEATGIIIHHKGKPACLMLYHDLTRRKRDEEALRKSEYRYRLLLETLPDPVVVHNKGELKYINQSGVQLLGIKNYKEVVGKPVLDFVHPESRELVIERMQLLSQEGSKVDALEEKFIRSDGSYFEGEVTGVGIEYEGRTASLLVIRDISLRKKIEGTLRKRDEQYRLIAENMTDLVCVLDVNSVVKYASLSHEFVMGFSPEMYEGASVFNNVYPEDVPKVQKEFMEMINSKEHRVIEFRYKHANGHWVWVEAKSNPVLDEKGNIIHFLFVARDITERKLYEKKLSHMAYHDTLTGVANRRLFSERLKQSLKEAERYGGKMAVMYMDMDEFKSINDTLGHDVGDELLKKFVERVKGCLRKSDTLGRQGGDEFTVLLSQIQGEQDALQVAERILESLREPWEIGEHVLETTSSIGIAFYPADGTTRHELMKHADKALYKAKGEGKNTMITYSVLC